MNLLPKPLLVLDLDETLIHCKSTPFREAQHSNNQGFVCVRDGLDEFLNKVNEHYDMMVWSNSGPEYVHTMLALIWPEDITLVDIFTSAESSRKIKEGLGFPFFKDVKTILKKHPGYSKNRILALDDKPEVWSRNYGNLVSVSPFHGQPDTELEKAAHYLSCIRDVPDLRALEKRYWKNKPIKTPLINNEYCV